MYYDNDEKKVFEEQSMKSYTIKKILVPIDFSPLSLNAAKHAVTIAKATRAKIILLHVIQPIVELYGDSSMVLAASKLEDEVMNKNTKRIESLAATLHKQSKIPVHKQVVVGTIDTMIVHTAEKDKADLIVMGTHGANGFLDTVLGSTTYSVVALSKIPVLSVHKPPSRAGYSHLVYPVREETQYMDKFPYALMFARMFKARIDIVGLLRAGQDKFTELMHARCSTLQDKFARYKVQARMVFTKNEYFADETISHAYPNSLVVIMQDQDFSLSDLFRKSFTKGIVQKALAPVLTIPLLKQKVNG